MNIIKATFLSNTGEIKNTSYPEQGGFNIYHLENAFFNAGVNPELHNLLSLFFYPPPEIEKLNKQTIKHSEGILCIERIPWDVALTLSPQ